MTKIMVGMIITLGLFASGPLLADMEGGREAILKGDFARAFKEFKEDAEKGNPHAMAPVAVMLHLGQGVKRDLKQAFSWYKKAAEKGYEAGMANVGIMHFKGAGTSQSDVEAYAWLDLASSVRGGREHNGKAWAESFLSPQQLEEAKVLASQLRKKYGKK